MAEIGEQEMKPEFVKKPEMTLVGIVGCAPDVTHADIYAPWQRFDDQHSEHIRYRVEEKVYEIHIQEETTPPMHFCLVGAEVRRIEQLPIELFVKVIPACEYAVFTHQFKDGGFDHAFKGVYDWLENSEYASAYRFDVQCYNSRFKSPDDPESVVEIWVPIMPK